MFQFVILAFATTLLRVSAYSGNGHGGGGGAIGTGYFGQVIPVSIQSRHKIQFIDVPSSGSVQPATVEVGARHIPFFILFRSASSTLQIQHAHNGASGSVQESKSEDEPHVLRHLVTKPIVQEIREVITPSRKIVQEVQPLQEEILTVVARENGIAGPAGPGAPISAGGPAPAGVIVPSAGPGDLAPAGVLVGSAGLGGPRALAPTGVLMGSTIFGGPGVLALTGGLTGSGNLIKSAGLAKAGLENGALGKISDYYKY